VTPVASGAFAIVIVGAALPIKISMIVMSTVTVMILLAAVVFAMAAVVVAVVGLVMIVGTLINVVGLLIVGVDIDITVGLLMEGDIGITTDIADAGIDTAGTIEDGTTVNGSTAGAVIPAPLEPDPWIGNAPGVLNALFWAKAVPTKPPRDAERRYSSFVMLRIRYIVGLVAIVT